MKIIFMYILFPFSIIFSAPQFAQDMANRMVMRPQLYYGPPSKAQYIFQGYLKNSKIETFKSSIYYEDSLKSFVRVDDSNFFDHNDSTKRYTKDYDSLIALIVDIQKSDTTKIKGVVNGEKWIFPKIIGKMSLYTDEPGSSAISYMSYGSKDLISYNKDEFRKIVFENKSSAALLNNRDIGVGISWIMLIGGGVISLVGLFDSDKEVSSGYGYTVHQFDASPLIFVGLGLVGTSWIPYAIVKDNYIKAVYTFNLK